MREYDPLSVEAKWQKVWEDQHAFWADPDPDRPKYYLLEMLPYPSGTLHMGHMRNYTIGDTVARYRRMRGYNVLHPMGWDAFGLPAENAAIQRNIHPREWTQRNVTEFKKVCYRFGFSYDWRREIATSDPEYYKWNQWIFLRMLERDLAYKKKSRVNWCPKCCTVLANEQVIDGKCWRHEDTQVEVRDIEQWFYRITKYTEELLSGLDELGDGWPERVVTMQRNWIGKSKGARVRFDVANMPGKSVEIFTTRIDTIYGASSVILAAGHPLLKDLLAGSAHRAEAEAQLAVMRQTSVKDEDVATAEKTGFFTGQYAINPFTKEKLPIWVGNFVLMEYGTGAIMAVPAHDQRDFEFCTKYKLPIPIVIQPDSGPPLTAENLKEASGDYGTLVNSSPYTGLRSADALVNMTASAEAEGFGRGETTYRLRDWGISRQRYWGTPIPIIYCEKDGMVPVPDADLPVRLPEKVSITGEGQSPLAGSPEFVNVKCPKCGGPARRETDTMDTFVDSSWYFLRYLDPHNDRQAFDPALAKYWFPVDQYIGGITHAILHLLYARFITKVLRDLGMVTPNEPFTRLFCQGMILKGGVVMSKSKGNVVGAMEMAEKYGADTGRLYTLFAAPPEKDMEWSEASVEGCARFLNRVFRVVDRHAAYVRNHAAGIGDLSGATEKEKVLLRKTHQSLQRVTHDLEERWHFNSAIAVLMELVNEIHAQEPLEEGVRPTVAKEVLELLTLMLAPMSPHLAEELWEMLGHTGGLMRASWPQFRAEFAAEEQVEIVVQVNGKVRARVKVEAGLDNARLLSRLRQDPSVNAHFIKSQILKEIVVPDKLVNFVIR
ncbi:MAG TPA: leucine--tRNA ligase [Candidatus Acidoferrales bacterium]